VSCHDVEAFQLLHVRRLGFVTGTSRHGPLASASYAEQGMSPAIRAAIGKLVTVFSQNERRTSQGHIDGGDEGYSS
jgi:hypothetical protein